MITFFKQYDVNKNDLITPDREDPFRKMYYCLYNELIHFLSLSQVKSAVSGFIMAPRVQVQSSLKQWFWTAPQVRVWSGPRSRWTVRASVNTASLSRPMTVGRDLMGSTARNPTS